MNGDDLKRQLDVLKRHFMDLVRDLHARKLAIPAGALLAAIVAALVLLPKGSSSVPAPPAASAPVVKPKIEPVAQISMVNASSLDEAIALTSSSDPFGGSTGYSCRQISSNPRTMECNVGGMQLRVICAKDDPSPACATGEGASGATGGAGGGGQTPGGSETGGGSTGGTGDGSDGSRKVWYAFEATLKIDNKTYKRVQVGDAEPSSAPLVVFAGADSSSSTATFIAAEGVTVSGVPIDPDFRAFNLRVGRTATLEDVTGKKHKLKLASLKLVPQKTQP